jgi:hypothetical protein
MATFLITVKLPKNPDHNPRDKKVGRCPLSSLPCTDVTGEHHSMVRDHVSLTAMEVRDLYQDEYHVTRVEEV